METTDKEANANLAGARIGNAAGRISTQDECAKREKTWDELTDMERIARMRRELIMLNELVQSQQALIERLMVHSHLPNGEMGVPMHASGRGFAGGLRRSPLA